MVAAGLMRALVIGLLMSVGTAWGQDKGSVNPVPLPPLPHADDPATPAKQLFARKPEPAPLAARAVGFYARGCLAGAQALPVNGPTWQVMRLSRNRFWGHPNLIAMLERLADKAPKVGWHGLLVGDISQPRGGPMLTGHASHQVGLDADIWLTPMPDRELATSGRHRIPQSSRPRPSSRRSSAFWLTPQSRKRCAGKPDPTAPGCRRCGRTTDTTTTFMSASNVRPAAPIAKHRRRLRGATVAARSSTGGSATPFCVRNRPQHRQSQDRRSSSPICRPRVGRY